MEEGRSAYKILTGKPTGKRPLGRPRLRCPSQEIEETSTLTRPVENIVFTTKGLQERNTQPFTGTKVEN